MVKSTEASLQKISDQDLPVHKGKHGNGQIQNSLNDNDQNNSDLDGKALVNDLAITIRPHFKKFSDHPAF